MRFTAQNRQLVLDQNEGFSRETYYDAKNYRETRVYLVTGGQLQITSYSKTSWADSHRKEVRRYAADDEETKRFLRSFRDELDLRGIE